MFTAPALRHKAAFEATAAVGLPSSNTTSVAEYRHFLGDDMHTRGAMPLLVRAS